MEVNENKEVLFVYCFKFVRSNQGQNLEHNANIFVPTCKKKMNNQVKAFHHLIAKSHLRDKERTKTFSIRLDKNSYYFVYKAMSKLTKIPHYYSTMSFS